MASARDPAPRSRPRLRRACCLGLLLLAGCGDPHDEVTRFLSHGESLLAARQPAKAQLEFRNALRLEPDHIAAWFGLARAERAAGHWQDEARALRAVLERDPSHLGALTELGDLYFRANAADAVAEHAARILAFAPAHPDGLTLQAGATLLRGDGATALATLDAILRQAPEHRIATSYAARASIAVHDLPRGIALLQRWLTVHPDDDELRLELAGMQETVGDVAGVRATRAELIRRAEDDRPHRLALTRFLLDHGDTEGATEQLAELIARHPEDLIARRYYLDLLREHSGPPRAIAAVELLLQARPKDLQLRLELARLHAERSDLPRAREILEAIRDELPSGSPAAGTVQVRLAALVAREGDTRTALQLLDAVLADNPGDREALILRATLRLDEQRPAAAINDLRMALRAGGDDANLRRLLARAHLANAETELASEQLRKAVASAPEDLALRQELAALYLDTGDSRGAIDELLAADRLRPGDFDLTSALCRAHASARDWPQALRCAERLQQLAPERAAGFHLAGMVQLELAAPEQAERNFTAALAREPDAVQPLTMLVRQYHAAGRNDAAEQLLRATIARYPGHAIAQHLLSELGG